MMTIYIHGKNDLDIHALGYSMAIACNPDPKPTEDPTDLTFFEVERYGGGFLGYQGEKVVVWSADRLLRYLLSSSRDEVLDVFGPYSGVLAENFDGQTVPVKPEIHIIIGNDKREDYEKKLIQMSGQDPRAATMLTHSVTVYRRSYDMFARDGDHTWELINRCQPWNSDLSEFAKFSKLMYEDMLHELMLMEERSAEYLAKEGEGND